MYYLFGERLDGMGEVICVPPFILLSSCDIFFLG